MYLKGKMGQSGFSATAALFMIALVVGIGSALLYENRDTPTNAAQETGKALVGVLLKQASDLRLGANWYMADTSSTLSNIKWDRDAGSGLFAPETKYALLQKAPIALTAGGTREWQFSRGALLPGVGTVAEELIVFVLNISDGACATANGTLYGQRFPVRALYPAFVLLKPSVSHIRSSLRQGKVSGTPVV